MSQIAYLVEPSHVRQSGKLSGTSLRAYEVTATAIQRSGYNGHTYQDVSVEPTGYLYQYQDGELVKKKTKARLADKYIPSRNLQIASTLGEQQNWGCSLFSTPEVAILSKTHNTVKSKAALEKQIAEMTANLETSTKTSIEAHNKLAELYPELLI
jgi:hypothetical protein